MKDTEQLEQALKLLRDADAERGASPFVETRLRADFRQHHAAKRRAFSFRWISVAGALACTAVVAWRLATPTAVEAPEPVLPAPPAVAKAPVAPPVVKQEPPVVVRKRPATPVTVAKTTPRPRPERREPAVQDFIAIPYAPPLTSWDRGQVMRVRLPRQTLRSLGIPVNEERMFERVPADLLMGEDGVARAIRFVSASELR